MPKFKAILCATFYQEIELEAATAEEAQASMPDRFDIKDAECDAVEVYDLTKVLE